MKRQKMITLCPTSYEIAQGMTNFSGWVRKQLLNMQIDNVMHPARQFVCTDCDTVLTTRGHDLHEVPHATRRLGEFMNESCQGYLVKVYDGDEE